jgi:redox-sensing transcriptional repressor
VRKRGAVLFPRKENSPPYPVQRHRRCHPHCGKQKRGPRFRAALFLCRFSSRSRYYRYLDDLHSKGIVRISSSLLGERMGITASQIRQDLSCFGEFGQQGYGYNILELRTEIGHILGVDEQHRLVVVGAGHLGHALLRNFDFMQTGFLLDTAFDVSPALIGTRVNNVLIRSFDEIGDYFAACHPDVAVLTVPKNIAQEVAEQLVALGVRGIWNFTNTELHVGSEIFTEDVHFADSLLTLSYRISKTSAEAEEEGAKP